MHPNVQTQSLTIPPLLSTSTTFLCLAPFQTLLTAHTTNQNRQSECPWAQDTDTQQFRRGPPTRDIKSSGNPINHTGYEEAQQQRMMKKSSGRGAGQCPWAQVSSLLSPSMSLASRVCARASPKQVGVHLAEKEHSRACACRTTTTPSRSPRTQLELA